MSARPEPLQPEMNVTPLVDVVLVLLIIFMVVTPQLQSGAQVELPAARNVDSQSEAQLEALTLSLTGAGELYLERATVERGALRQELEKAHAHQPSARLVLKADRSVAYREARALFKACQDAGFPGVSLQVLEAKLN